MILHIANDFSGSTVYKNLVLGLDDLNVSQVVYTAIRNKNLIGKNKVDFRNNDSKIIYSHILNKYIDRLLYKRKISKIYKDILEEVDFTKITYIHAHTWYSDGGVAYLLSKKFNIPFGVAIRNTDINIFYKYFIHERNFGKKILMASNNIFFISKVYKERTFKMLSFKNDIVDKVQIIPNGVDEFWIKNVVQDNNQKIVDKEIKLIFVGKLTSGKNIVPLMDSIVLLNQKLKQPCSLSIIGNGGNKEKEVLLKLEQYKEFNFFKYYGAINDKVKLKELYLSSDVFTLPSKPETFGLVYIEAMLMGLPVIYVKGEGIDTFYPDYIGEKVKAVSTEEIVKAIMRIIENYYSYKIPYDDIISNHNWSEIARKYKSLYLV